MTPRLVLGPDAAREQLLVDPWLAQRLWTRVDVTENCWLWLGYTDSDGYGRIKLGSRQSPVMRVHRLAYLLLVDSIPAELQLDHLCRVRHCVNPAHLEAVTPAVNIHRGESPSARAGRRTHCPHGHQLDNLNTYLSPAGHRQCRTCRKIHRKATAERQRGAS